MSKPSLSRPAIARALVLLCLPLAFASATAAPAAAAAPEIRVEPLSLAFNPPAPKTIYIEIDWMENGSHSHRPSQTVLDRMVKVFAANGYDVHLELSGAIPHQDVLAVTNRPSASPAVQSIVGQYFDHAGDPRWYYSLWAHNYSYNGTFTTSSGISDLPGRVSVITLGSFSNGVGSYANQVGTLVHELGHNLGQRHGGNNDENWKPNYLSVMNYFYQLQGIGPGLRSLGLADSTTGIDDFAYSHGLLPALNENALDERAGIGLGKPVDWDCDGVIEASVAKDIQGGSWCSASGGRALLGDFDNWSDLDDKISTFGATFGEGEAQDAVPCITREENDLFLSELASRGIYMDEAEEPGEDAATASIPEPDGAAAAASFTISNDGNADLVIGSLTLDSAASWIAWSPAAPFTVAPGRSQRVYVTVDLGAAPSGIQRRRLLVGSNDADENPYPGGVQLTVQGNGPACTDCGSAIFSDGFEIGSTAAWH